MRHRSEVSVILAVSAFALAGVSAMALREAEPVVMITPTDPAPIIVPTDPAPIIVVRSTDDADAWFQSIRQFCNPVEVETRMRWQPAPESPEGDMHRAACYALAGRIDEARGVIEGLPQDLRYRAAGVVLTGDCGVGIVDFLELLGAWGSNPGHPADFDDDGFVGITDFLDLLGGWGTSEYIAEFLARTG